jgi:hypothetical protein
MYSIVKRLYNKGVERPRADVTADLGYTGELVFAHVGLVPTATLTEPDDEFARPIIPSLEHA